MDRVLLMRAILERALEEDEQPKAFSRSDGSEDNQKASDDLERIADEAPDCEWFGAAWDYANARWHVRQSEATEEAYAFDEEPDFRGSYACRSRLRSVS